MIYTNVTNPKWANAEHTVIDCMVMSEYHGEIPFTAVASGDYEHSHKIYAECLEGKYGIIEEYTPPPSPTIEQLTVIIRNQRNNLLAQSDWTQLPDVPQATKDLWSTYRQALRDITTQSGFPTDVVWPTQPI
jgi:hypothetical protein